MKVELQGTQASAHFTWADIACNDATDTLYFGEKAQRHLRMMEALRSCFPFVFRVSSWFRTVAYNALPAVGGENGSLHTLGQATDITFGQDVLGNPTTLAVMNAIWQLLNRQNGTIGAMIIYPWGIHFDSYDDPTHQAALRKGLFYYKTSK